MTHAPWCSLYSTYADEQALAADLLKALLAQGYSQYNPFGIMPGKSYAHTVKLFVKPRENGWIRVICAQPPPLAVVQAACGGVTTLMAQINKTAEFAVFVDGEPASPADGLLPHLRDGKTAADLHQALHNPDFKVLPADGEPSSPVPLDVLPDDVKKMAGNIDVNALNKMFGKVTQQLMNKTGGDAQAASELLNQPNSVDWTSPQAARLSAVMALLTVDHWRIPDFGTLRDAYSLHARRQRNPNARLYPGDENAMQAVPNALDYIPVYAGKDD